ncbi:MAG TPA: hypothetical protein VNW95_11715 [Mucilaginibacter sp.]|jgi:hypothetical protein|nr:hypothetical protein [Mucilaginibacter sp.]
MKTSIKFTALLLLAGASVFAAIPAKAAIPPKVDAITFASLSSLQGLAVKAEKNLVGKATIIISDQDGNVLRKDELSNKAGMEKDYILTKLDEGDYTIEVASKGNSVKQDIHVYTDGKEKMFFIKQ